MVSGKPEPAEPGALCLTQREGRVAHVYFNRAAKRNSLNSQLVAEATLAIRSLSADPTCLVIVISGRGGVFSAGADVREMQTLAAEPARRFITNLHLLFDAVRQAPQIVIAALAGHCYGGALELAAACDLRIAAAGTLMGMPEVRVGMPSVIEAALLPLLIGHGPAADLVLTGDSVDATAALRLGLVSRVVAAERLEEEAAALARRLAGYSGPALRAQKRLLRSWLESPTLAQAVEASIETYAETFNSPNPAEAIAAFLQRREPIFPEA